MKKWMMVTGLALSTWLVSCNGNGDITTTTIVDSEFETGTDGWTAEFSEYSKSTDSASLQMSSGRERLPTGLDTTRYAFMMESMNGSDDMFMFLKKRVTGLVPNQEYVVSVELNLGTNYPENSFGTGGSPGSSVYLKAGASATEPQVALGSDGFYHFSLDKGQQSQAGKDAVLLGNVANGEENAVYRLVKRTNAPNSLSVRANSGGEIWVFTGTDSGFEGLTTLYYDRIRVTIQEVRPD